MKQPRPVGVDESHHKDKDAVAEQFGLNQKSPEEQHIEIPVKK